MSLMLAIAGLNPPAPPAPQQQQQPQGGGPPWADRSESAWFYIGDDGEPVITDDWREALRSKRHEVIGDFLAVSVPKVQLQILEPEVLMAVNDSMKLNDSGEYEVDRGQPITVMVTWKAITDNVFFSYLPPGEEIPVVDDGINQPTTIIEKVEDGTYRAKFSTEGFEAGVCWIHFWGTLFGKTVVAKYGCIRIKDVPPQI